MKLKKLKGLELLSEKALSCSHCGCNYTQQGEVSDLIYKTTDGEGNPSARRNGLLIKFECEECQQSFYVGVSQHKGQTFFDYFVED